MCIRDRRLCGHATLAAASVLLTEDGTVRFETLSGTLTVTRAGELLTMDFPAIPPAPAEAPEGLLETLGGAPEAFFNVRSVHGARYHMAAFATADEVAALTPDTVRMGRDFNANIIATAPGADGIDFVSRFFAPASGVPEDPVTGSAHCTLAPYWAERLSTSTLVGRQISRRGGTVRCEVRGDRVALSGTCIRYLQGLISV